MSRLSTLRASTQRRDSCTPSEGNSVELLPGGQAFYPRMLADIEAAQEEILVGTYLWEADETGRSFLEATRVAAQRGIRVRLLLDGLGSHGVDREELESLEAAGGRFAFYHALRFPLIDSRLMRRFHRKLLVIDGRVAYTGGAGFADGWIQPPPTEWWDLMARIKGPAVSDLHALFAQDWARATHEKIPRRTQRQQAQPHAPQTLQMLVTRRGQPELLRKLRLEIATAQAKVHLVSAYFVPGFRLRRVLRRAARRGVEVSLLLPGPRTDHIAVRAAGRRYYHKLLQSGVRIYEFQRSMLHSKYAVVDERWGFIGSSNLDNWSARFNQELDLGLHNGPAVEALSTQFVEDLGAAREITLKQWRERPFSSRLLETVFGWIDPLL
ncbi:MAG: phospholipase D-like domain-containing protein [Planctomycetota bacterium]|nr:phospholipase D-like domain-containing protein [Planctomycetota bacterium]